MRQATPQSFASRRLPFGFIITSAIRTRRWARPHDENTRVIDAMRGPLTPVRLLDAMPPHARKSHIIYSDFARAAEGHAGLLAISRLHSLFVDARRLARSRRRAPTAARSQPPYWPYTVFTAFGRSSASLAGIRHCRLRFADFDYHFTSISIFDF